MQALEGLFAHAAVGAADKDQVVTLRQLYLFARLVFHHGEREIRVFNHGENSAWSNRDFACGSEDCFYLC